MKRKLSMALLALAAVLAGWLGVRLLRSATWDGDTDLVALHFQPYPVPMTAPLDEDLRHWLAGVVQYNGQSYALAEAEWRASAQAREAMPAFMLDFYTAQACMAQGRHDSAAAALARVVQGRNDITPLARWYLGLAQLGKGDTLAARHQFTILSEEGGYRSRDAGFILEEI